VPSRFEVVSVGIKLLNGGGEPINTICEWALHVEGAQHELGDELCG
jgi:hypothetical protein